ncbi:MAG: zinc-binding dehydrogenase, partial [Planctomycetales bacterium]|nr:zinc-binding dehydrogenase [Planctomycetales bacterium]
AWGSFAPLVRIDFADHNLVRLPDAFDFITGASLGCRFATAYRAVMLQGQLRPGQWLAVFGCGGVGLSAVMIGVAQGARAIAIDTNAQALRLASQLGAELVINANKTRDVERFIMNCTGGGADVSIDALGHAETCCQSILSLRKQGRHVQVGLLLGDQSRPRIPMERVIGWELQLLGSHGLAAPDYAPLLQLIEAGTIMPQQLVTQTIALEQAPNQLAQMGRFPFAGVTVIDRFA